MAELHGKIDGIVFSNRQTGFYILKVRPEGESSLVAVKGSFPGIPIGVGVKAKFVGDWTDHPTYGRQFQATLCDVVPEKGRNGIMTYLSANVPSIGPITAAKLYDAIGDDLPSVLENDPDKIRALPFLNKNQADALLSEWSVASEGRTASIFLADLGLNSVQIRSVYTKFGAKTKETVRANPYSLYECPSVGFIPADTAARKLGVGVDDPRRVRAMVLFFMNELSQSEGHMYCTSKQIQDYARKMFRRHSMEPFSHGEYISDSGFYSALTELQKSDQLVSVDDRIYLDRHWDHESTSAECLSEMISQEPYVTGNLVDILTEFEAARGVTLSEEQRQAFFMLDRSRVCVVSGFPGTGKTLLVSAFVHLFEKLNLHYTLMSPTGIAAKRLSQVTGKPASTIHRALCYQKDGTWEFNAGNKFYVDAVIVDEMSMVDGSTFFHLISALPPTTIIILVGDSAQLPSVGAGYVLNNLMKCPVVPHVALTRIYRQEKLSDIISVAHSVLRGEKVETRFNPKSEFLFLNFKREQVLEEMCKMATALKGRDANFQVIAPMYDGDLGVNNLNRKLREVLNSEFASGKANKLKHGDVDFYEGDRVMVVKNDYDRAIFNGDVGKITRISTKSDEIEVKVFDWFDQESNVPRYVDKVFTFKVEEARHVLKVAYACTAHKVQGQEFDFVLMPMTMQYGIMLYRNLVYTAITRAKKKVFIFGDPDAFSYAISNDRETVRNSHLNALVRQSVESPDAPESAEVLVSDAVVAAAEG